MYHEQLLHMHPPRPWLLIAALFCAVALARSSVVPVDTSDQSAIINTAAIERITSDVVDALEASISSALRSVVSGGANDTTSSLNDSIRRQLAHQKPKANTGKSKQQSDKDVAAARKRWWQAYWRRQRQQQQSTKIPQHLVYPTCVGQSGDTAEITITNSMQGTTWQGWGTALAW